MNTETEGDTTENTSEDEQTRPIGRLRDLRPEKDPMGAGRKSAPIATSTEAQPPRIHE